MEPFTGVSVSAVVADCPAGTVNEMGFAETVKSGAAATAFTVTLATEDWLPLKLASPKYCAVMVCSPMPPAGLRALTDLIDAQTISGSQGKTVFAEMFAIGKTAAQIVEEKGLKQMSDSGAMEALCDQAIAASAKAVAEYKAGKVQAINSIKGQVMKLSQGKANPVVVSEILARKLAE